MRPRVFVSCLALSCWLALPACSANVLLGSECPELDGPCGEGPGPRDAGSRPGPDQDARGPRPTDSGARRDANGRDEPERDTGLVEIIDAAVDPDALLALLTNPSFELLPGAEPGSVTTVPLPTWTAIDPWYTCQAIGSGMAGPLSAVRAEHEVVLGDADAGTGQVVRASDGDTFIGIQYLLGALPFPLLQRLPRSLPAGAKVGLAVDVLVSRATSAISLQVWGGTNDCLNDINQHYWLASTQPVTSTEWQTVCLNFTMPPGVTHLALVTDFSFGGLLENDRLFFDNLRSASECEGAEPGDEGS